MMKIRYILGFLLLSSFLFARSDALVIGIGKYQYDVHELTGVNKDIFHIKSILKVLNVHNIKELKNEQATLNGVRRAFEKYINSSLNKEGNIFVFYYTGHGLEVRDGKTKAEGKDEIDGKDEAFALYDFKMNDSKVISKGLLLDDELQSLLSRIKSKKILILDKCYSDTSYRAVFDFSKSFGDFKKNKYSLSKRFTKDTHKNYNKYAKALVNYIALGASKDNEIAEDSPRGGLFTLALYDAIVDNRAGNKAHLTMKKLQDFCRNQIHTLASNIRKSSKGSIDIEGDFAPQFRPNRILSDRLFSLFKIKSANNISKPKKYLLENILDDMSSKNIITLKSSKRVYKHNRPIRFDITSKKTGYLNVFIAYKNTYRLYKKNKHINSNHTYTFPDDFLSSQHLIAKKSYGTTKIYAILSKKKVNIKNYLSDIKKNNFALINSFRKELISSEEYRTQKNEKRVRRINNIISVGRVTFDVR